MKAIVCVPGGVEVADVKDPAPAGDEVVIAVEACGLCGSGASVSAGWIGQAVTADALVRLRTPDGLVRVLTRPWD